MRVQKLVFPEDAVDAAWHRGMTWGKVEQSRLLWPCCERLNEVEGETVDGQQYLKWIYQNGANSAKLRLRACGRV